MLEMKQEHYKKLFHRNLCGHYSSHVGIGASYYAPKHICPIVMSSQHFYFVRVLSGWFYTKAQIA